MFVERIAIQRRLADSDRALNGGATLQLIQVAFLQLKLPPDVANFRALVVTRNANLDRIKGIIVSHLVFYLF